MSKLFEVQGVTYHADRISFVARVASPDKCAMRSDGFEMSMTINEPYERVVQAWRKALDGDPDPAQLSQCEDMRKWLAYCTECAKEYREPNGFHHWRAARLRNV